MARAILESDTNKIAYLIEKEHYNVNRRGNAVSQGRVQRFTYLNYAVLVGDVKSTEKLLQLGADINLIALDGGGQLGNMNITCNGSNTEMINLLLKYKVNLNNPLVESPIELLLVYNADKKLVELLINSGANLNHQNYIDGGAPIITALDIDKFDYVNYFLDKGADPMLLESSGNSFAYLLQEEINEGRLSDYGLKEYTKLKDRLIKEFHVKFP